MLGTIVIFLLLSDILTIYSEKDAGDEPVSSDAEMITCAQAFLQLILVENFAEHLHLF